MYARAAAAMLGIDRMGDENWQERERRYGTTGETKLATTTEGQAAQTTPKEVPTPVAPRPRKKRPAKFFGNRR